MTDKSFLDKKYFVDSKTYNCPYCKRNNVVYETREYAKFDWTENKKCFVYFVTCSSCNKTSMHLSYEDIIMHGYSQLRIKEDIDDLDSKIFYSVPTSFFVIDSRIPSVIRDLITEADGCLKMNFLTGASSCMRKSIYELLVLKEIIGDNYEEKIKALKIEYQNIDSDYFDILASIQNMTSDKIHEQSWDKWDSNTLIMLLETLKIILYEIYVLPEERKDRSINIKKLRKSITESKKKI
jgi:hypothetical protein